MTDRWVTPQASPTTTQAATIEVPNDPVYIAILRGLFIEAAKPENWQSIGGITPEEAAEWASEIGQSFEVNYA